MRNLTDPVKTVGDAIFFELLIKASHVAAKINKDIYNEISTEIHQIVREINDLFANISHR